MWLTLLATALAAEPFGLPAGERRTDWEAALALAGFVPTDGAAVVWLEPGSGRWHLVFADGRPSVDVDRPGAPADREGIAWLAQSLLHPVVPARPTAPLPSAGVAAVPAGGEPGVGRVRESRGGSRRFPRAAPAPSVDAPLPPAVVAEGAPVSPAADAGPGAEAALPAPADAVAPEEAILPEEGVYTRTVRGSRRLWFGPKAPEPPPEVPADDLPPPDAPPDRVAPTEWTGVAWGGGRVSAGSLVAASVEVGAGARRRSWTIGLDAAWRPAVARAGVVVSGAEAGWTAELRPAASAIGVRAGLGAALWEVRRDDRSLTAELYPELSAAVTLHAPIRGPTTAVLGFGASGGSGPTIEDLSWPSARADLSLRLSWEAPPQP